MENELLSWQMELINKIMTGDYDSPARPRIGKTWATFAVKMWEEFGIDVSKDETQEKK